MKFSEYTNFDDFCEKNKFTRSQGIEFLKHELEKLKKK